MTRDWVIAICFTVAASAQTPPPAPEVAPVKVRAKFGPLAPPPPVPPADAVQRINEAVEDLLDLVPPMPPMPPAELIEGVIDGIDSDLIGGVAGDVIARMNLNRSVLASQLSLLAQAPPPPTKLPNPGSEPRPGIFSKDAAWSKGKDNDENRLYERGQRAIENRRYEEALGYFSEIAARAGSRTDGALYWKAYTENKLGRRSEALATINQLRTGHPNSRWLDDAKALDAEVRAGQGQPQKPEDAPDDDLKLMALNSLAQNDPERAIPMIEKLLTSSQTPKLKERALFVLMQTGSPKAREVVVAIASGKGNPDLQLRAINYLGTMNGRKELAQVYASANDSTVKRAVLRGFMVSGAREELFNAAKNEKDPELRREAIRQLGVMGSQNELWQIYQQEGDVEIKKELVRGFFVGGSADKLMDLARMESHPGVRREAIRNLGNMDQRRSLDGLVALYGTEQDKDVRKEIIRALSHQSNAVPLIDIARKETDPELKKEIVRRLSTMRSKEATDYMLELLK